MIPTGEDGRIAPGVHAATLNDLRSQFGEGSRASVADAVGAVVTRLRELIAGAEVIIGGPFVDPLYEGAVPYAKVVATAPWVAIDRASVDDSLVSLLSLSNIVTDRPMNFDRLIPMLHPVGGLLQTQLMTQRLSATAEWWAGRIMDPMGHEDPSGQSTGIVKVVWA